MFYCHNSGQTDQNPLEIPFSNGLTDGTCIDIIAIYHYCFPVCYLYYYGYSATILIVICVMYSVVRKIFFTATIVLTTSPQSNLRRVRRKGPLVTMGCPKFTPKLPLPLRRSPPLSNTPIPRPTPLTTSNGIRIQMAVLPQYTFRTDRQTGRQTDRQMV